MRRLSVAIATVTLVGGGSLGYFLGVAAPSATAIPASQRACVAAGERAPIRSNPPQAIAGLTLSINNGTSPRNVVVQFSADMRVDSGAEVMLSYSIDGGPATEAVFGPAHIADPSPFLQARSTIAVIPLGTGVHTITPFWRTEGDEFAEGSGYARCFTAEGRTR